MLFNNKLTPVFLTICLLLTIALSGCGSSAKFRKEIKLMSDEQLVGKYYGIKAGIRDIDRDVRVDEHFNDRSRDNEEFRWRSPLFLGGKGYNLNQKKKMIEKEMIKRNITF